MNDNKFVIEKSIVHLQVNKTQQQNGYRKKKEIQSFSFDFKTFVGKNYFQ